MIPNFCSPWSDFKGREAHPDRGGNVFGPRATCVSYQSVATDWRLGGNGERQNRQKLFRSRSLSSSNSLTIIWSTESDHVWVYNLENSNAPALPVWTHTHTHTWERERSVAVRASGLKIRKGSPECPLAWDLKGWISDLMRKELAEEDQRECFRQSRHICPSLVGRGGRQTWVSEDLLSWLEL